MRRVTVGSQSANLLVPSNFEHWTVLSDYLAILDRKDQMVEASIRLPFATRLLPQVLPGVVQDPNGENLLEAVEPSDDSAEAADRLNRLVGTFRILLTHLPRSACGQLRAAS